MRQEHVRILYKPFELDELLATLEHASATKGNGDGYWYGRRPDTPVGYPALALPDCPFVLEASDTL